MAKVTLSLCVSSISLMANAGMVPTQMIGEGSPVQPTDDTQVTVIFSPVVDPAAPLQMQGQFNLVTNDPSAFTVGKLYTLTVEAAAPT